MEAGAVPRVAPPLMPTLSPRILRLASDSRLVGLVREGRPGAFEAVYDRHHKGILSFCRHMLGDQDEAEDAVQHTFMAAYADLTTSQKPIHLRPWLFAIARNRCYSLLRSRRERPASEFDEPVTEGLASQVQRRQELRDLVSDMRRLPDEQRAAIVLAELECLSHSEIGDVLGVPKEKVKALVFQARESLVASRTARETACAEIREQLACGRGGSLRRGNLRRHLRECDGCRAFRGEVERQRKHFAILLPVAPTLILKEGILAAAVGGGVVAVGGGGLIASSALKTGLVKGVIAVVMAGVGTAGTVVVSASNLPIRSLLHPIAAPVVHVHRAPSSHAASASAASAPAAAASVQQAHASASRFVSLPAHKTPGVAGAGHHRHRALREHGAARRGPVAGRARHDHRSAPAALPPGLARHHGGGALSDGRGHGPPPWAHDHGHGGGPPAWAHGHGHNGHGDGPPAWSHGHGHHADVAGAHGARVAIAAVRHHGAAAQSHGHGHSHGGGGGQADAHGAHGASSAAAHAGHAHAGQDHGSPAGHGVHGGSGHGQGHGHHGHH